MYLENVKRMYDFQEFCEIKSTVSYRNNRISINRKKYNFLKSLYLKIRFKKPEKNFYNYSTNNEKPVLHNDSNNYTIFELPYSHNEVLNKWKEIINNKIKSYDLFWKNNFELAKLDITKFDEWEKHINSINSEGIGIINFDFSLYSIDTFYDDLTPLIVEELQREFNILYVSSDDPIPFLVELFETYDNSIYIKKDSVVRLEHIIKKGRSIKSDININILLEDDSLYTNFYVTTEMHCHNLVFRDTVKVKHIDVYFNSAVFINSSNTNININTAFINIALPLQNPDKNIGTLYKLAVAYYNQENIVELLYQYMGMTFISKDNLLHMKKLLQTYDGYIFNKSMFYHHEIQEICKPYDIDCYTYFPIKNKYTDNSNAIISQPQIDKFTIYCSMNDVFLEEMYLDEYIFSVKRNKNNIHLSFLLSTLPSNTTKYERELITHGFVGINLSFFKDKISNSLYEFLMEEYENNILKYFQYFDILTYEDFYQLKIRLNVNYSEYLYKKWLLKQKNKLQFNVLSTIIYRNLSMSLLEYNKIKSRCNLIIPGTKNINIDALNNIQTDKEYVFFCNETSYTTGAQVLENPLHKKPCIIKSGYEIQLYETQYHTKLYKKIKNDTNKNLEFMIESYILSFMVLPISNYKYKNVYVPISLNSIISTDIEILPNNDLKRNFDLNLASKLENYIQTLLDYKYVNEYKYHSINPEELQYFLIYNFLNKPEDILHHVIDKIEIHEKSKALDIFDINVFHLLKLLKSKSPHLEYPPVEFLSTGKTCFLPIELFFSNSIGFSSLNLHKDYELKLLFHYDLNLFMETDIIFNFVNSQEIKLSNDNLIHAFQRQNGDRFFNDNQHLRFTINGNITNLFFIMKKKIKSIKIYFNDILIFSDINYFKFVNNMYYNSSNHDILKLPFCLLPTKSNIQPNGYLTFDENVQIDCLFEQPINETDFILYFTYYRYI